MKFTIILNSTNDPLNIGSVLRAMTNLGFTELRLVAPRNYDKHRVKITACNSSHLISNIKEYESIESATQDINEIIGFTARHGKHRGSCDTGSIGTLPEWINSVKSASSNSGASNIGLMFGSEDNGLTHEDISWCTKLLTIPTAGEYSSFNLAQAVTVTLYSIFVYLEENTLPTPDFQEEDLPATFKLASGEQFSQLENILFRVLKVTGFLKDSTPTPIPLLIRRIFRRARPTVREMQVILGIFGRVDRALSGKVPIAKKENSND